MKISFETPEATHPPSEKRTNNFFLLFNWIEELEVLSTDHTIRLLKINTRIITQEIILHLSPKTIEAD